MTASIAALLLSVVAAAPAPALRACPAVVRAAPLPRPLSPLTRGEGSAGDLLSRPR